MITKDRQYCIAEAEDGKAKCKFCVWIDPEKSIWQAVCRSILKIVGYHFQMISWTWISKRCNPSRCNNEVIASSCQSKTTEIKISVVFCVIFCAMRERKWLSYQKASYTSHRRTALIGWIPVWPQKPESIIPFKGLFSAVLQHFSVHF